jgi:transposase-like protein
MKCPRCQSDSLVKKGLRSHKFETVQTYQCKTCRHRFSEKSFLGRSYPSNIVYHALVLYHQGSSMDEVRIKLNKQFKIRIGISTIHSWIHRYSTLCPINTIRARFADDISVLFRKRFEHENLNYEFMYHNYKLNKKVKAQFPGLYQYLKRFEQGCPDEFFEIGKRCSQPVFAITLRSRRSKNLACEMVAFSEKAAPKNNQRHKYVEEFMLVNDTATIACEIPVWYWEKGIDEGVTGHIDLLQVRNDMVYILDYKPDAAKDRKAAGQLYHYAAALSFRTDIPFEKIRCAWFDKDDYFEFSMTSVKASLKKK